MKTTPKPGRRFLQRSAIERRRLPEMALFQGNLLNIKDELASFSQFFLLGAG